MRKKLLFCLLLWLLSIPVNAENGYDCWLRYIEVKNIDILLHYRNSIKAIQINGNSPTMGAIKSELSNGLKGLLGITTPFSLNADNNATLRIGSASLLGAEKSSFGPELQKIGTEGFIIRTRKKKSNKGIVITANSDIGVLYGVFYFLKLLQTNQSIDNLNIVSLPKLSLRMLNHWDNLNRTVERGYAGSSIWNWHTLPTYIDKRYIDYARLNASIGINAVSLTNVNANAAILTRPFLEKVKALADAFRPYGIKVFLTARFSSPIEIGKLKTADPLDSTVQNWWNNKANEIYSLVPDFAGFLIKANSEGQPGPQNYNRSHADGANMLADAVAPHKGIVIWRAFVYSNENPEDRHKQAYNEFAPLDGKFRNNVILQVKNGAIDFMPREPFHPLFGAMPKTPLMMEFQVTQEYLGQSTNLVYLAPLFKEVLQSDTYSKGKGSTVAKIIDGSIDHHTLNGMTGVANIGSDINWCGHPFAQANWYALGRLAWDYELTSEQIAAEWLKMTFSNNSAFIKGALPIMLQSRDILVQYSNPIGLHHIMGTGNHYGPAPWVNNLNRPEWNPVYYHKADSTGIGFNRTSTGSNAIGQYFPEARKMWEDIDLCEEKNLLWFHHVPWNYTLKSKSILWDELCFQYYTGANRVKEMQHSWDDLKQYTDLERYNQVRMLLKIQQQEAIWWRNACLLYFQQFSKMPIPTNYEKPDKSLEYYMGLNFSFAPGN
jgi:alpha-glucuronidase